jgi:DNA-binding transcriptional MerR regulator
VVRVKAIGEVSELSGVSIQMLRYYDKIGLLRPRARSSAGYRLYGRDELLRLREILVWYQLGFSLKDVARLIDDPFHDRAEALRRQLELANAQLDRFLVITRGLERAIAAMDEEGAGTDDDVFADFASSLTETEAGSASESGRRQRLTTFGVLSDRLDNRHSNGWFQHEPSDGASIAARVAVTDPIRMGESLMALGVLPFGSFKYANREPYLPPAEPSARPTVVDWPWPPLVEPVVRARIRDFGTLSSGYRIDGSSLELTRPDLTICWPWQADSTASAGPTELLDWSHAHRPGFANWLDDVARSIGLTERVPALLASWDARTRALRVHLEGREVACLYAWHLDVPKKARLTVPTETWTAQAFTDVGLSILSPHDVSAIGLQTIDPADVADLDAPSAFVGVYCASPRATAAFYASECFRTLPATNRGAVTYQDWSAVRPGWFSTHWQLHQIAQAFGLCQIRVEDADQRVFGVINRRSGRTSFVSACGGTRLTLSGPTLLPLQLDLDHEVATTISIDPTAAERMAAFPESFGGAFGNGGTFKPLLHDRESALARLAHVAV